MVTRAKRPPPPSDPFPWKYRRLLVFFTIGCCALGVGYLTIIGSDTRLAETLAWGYFGLWTATLGSYVFGAVWHDRGLMEHPRRGRPRRRRVEASEDEPDEDDKDDANVEDR